MKTFQKLTTAAKLFPKGNELMTKATVKTSFTFDSCLVIILF